MGESTNIKLKEAFQKITPEFIDNLNAVYTSEICPSKKGYENLKKFIGDGFAFVCDTTSTVEDRHIFKKFTQQVMKSKNFIYVIAQVLRMKVL